MFLDLRQASEKYFTSCQFLAHDLRQVISRPHTWQGLLGKDCLFPLNEVGVVLIWGLHFFFKTF